jgi:hypothetical protein
MSTSEPGLVRPAINDNVIALDHPAEWWVRHVRTGKGTASFDVFHDDGAVGPPLRGTLVALTADEEREISERLSTGFPVYATGPTKRTTRTLAKTFGYPVTEANLEDDDEAGAGDRDSGEVA